MYQPEDSSSEGEGMGEAGERGGADTSEEDPTPAGEEDVKDACQEGGADASEEDPTPAGEEDIKDAGEEGGADSWEEDPTPAGEEEGADASEEDLIPAGEDDGADAGEEDDTVTNEKADSVLNFLKSTQEMYFYDGVSRDAASAALADAAEELLGHLASHSMPPSDVSILHHLKTLLLLQDTERLKRALEMFPEHCTMPPASTLTPNEKGRTWCSAETHADELHNQAPVQNPVADDAIPRRDPDWIYHQGDWQSLH
ncbi:glutamate-rich protein 1 isoform X6 [Macaca fascicularis]